MEQNLHVLVVAKKLRGFIRAILFMIKKNISKRQPLLDLNLMMKRGKLAGKALHNLMLHHHRRRSPDNFAFPHPPTQDYHEFSCSNTPVYPLSLFTTRKKHLNHKTSTQLQKKLKPGVVKDESYDHEIFVDPAVIKMLEMLTSATASPAVPGFGKSPMAVRQLRVTDSPFPLSNFEEEDGHRVDEAADKFIMKFYNDLRRQNVIVEIIIRGSLWKV